MICKVPHLRLTEDQEPQACEERPTSNPFPVISVHFIKNNVGATLDFLLSSPLIPLQVDPL